jgi:hypothetical protein
VEECERVFSGAALSPKRYGRVGDLAKEDTLRRLPPKVHE